MRNASFLVLVAESTKPSDLEPFLQSVYESQARLIFMVLGAMPPSPVFTYGMEPYGISSVPDNWSEEIESAKAKLTLTAQAIEGALQSSGASGEVGVLSCEPASISSAIARRAATCDAVLVSDELRSDRAIFYNAVHGALFLSPVGTFLNGTSKATVLSPSRVFIAWDTSLPAARAVHLALPFLKEAKHITVGVFDPDMSAGRDGQNPGSDVARWLSHHGCVVDVQQLPSGGEEIGAAIMRRAADIDADLVVMGAYGHSRMRQAVFGGTTRTIIEQTGMPVFLAH